MLECQAQSVLTEKADSLFSEKKYSEASIYYEDLLAKHDINKSNAYLKLAYIYEKQGDFVKTIYNLNRFYLLNPSDQVFDKINLLAKENGFSGYDRTDLNFFLMLYRQYFKWILALFLVTGIYVFVVLWIKKNKNQEINRAHKYTLTAYIIGLILLVNITDKYQIGIVKTDKAYLRNGPSAGATVVGNISAGNRLNIIGKKDIWYRIIYQKQFVYLKADDLWVIEQ